MPFAKSTKHNYDQEKFNKYGFLQEQRAESLSNHNQSI
ncbi:hypothetical protein HBZS_122580 [Helicobacter bizzozeronii CCUG 35545]|nr:hypothetical protein HBZS_122580 [Helicobacter bizzozeronii CCUG 35545]